MPGGPSPQPPERAVLAASRAVVAVEADAEGGRHSESMSLLVRTERVPKARVPAAAAAAAAPGVDEAAAAAQAPLSSPSQVPLRCRRMALFTAMEKRSTQFTASTLLE